MAPVATRHRSMHDAIMTVCQRPGARGAVWAASALGLCLASAPQTATAAPTKDDTWARPPKSERPPPPAWRKTRIDARFVVAVSPVLGPHAFGNQQCNNQDAICDRAGRFLGLGGTLELRARLHKILYAHARFLGVGNAIGHKPVFGGLLAPGLGLGVYGKLAFIRGEYMFYVPVGGKNCTTLDPSGAEFCDAFEVPFGSDEAGEAIWSAHAGLISGGLRYRLKPRMVGELWGGLVVGPRERRLLFDQAETRTLTSFLVGVGLAFDVVQ